MISIIAAIGKNRELGKNNKLLWYIPEDFKRFKELTSGHVIIMGRKTYESIGKPLPNRVNIIVTRDIKKFEIRNSKSKTNSNFQNSNNQNGFEFRDSYLEFNKNFVVCSSLEIAIKKAKRLERNEIFIIGGAEIYKQGIKYADKLYLTLVDKEFPDADAFFPDYSQFKKIVFEENHASGNIKFKFVDLTK